MPTLTVVVPALNEAERLPVLLGALDRQTRRPDAVVVADAGSTDATREIATAHGARVVDGGMPAVGRNAGAAVADTDLILFFDADNVPPASWIEQALAEFSERELIAATAHIAPLEETPGNLFACDVANLYLDLIQFASPHAPGFCILIERAAHEAIGGYDESIVLAEDHDYVQRAAKTGKFRVLRGDAMPTSMRRIGKEGLVRLAFMYLYTEVYAIQGKPIHSVPFDYEFGAFEPAEKSAPLVNIEELRTGLGEAADQVAAFPTEALERLKRLGDMTIDADGFRETLRTLEPDQAAEFRRYLKVRLRLARRSGSRAIAQARNARDTIWQRTP